MIINLSNQDYENAIKNGSRDCKSLGDIYRMALAGEPIYRFKPLGNGKIERTLLTQDDKRYIIEHEDYPPLN